MDTYSTCEEYVRDLITTNPNMLVPHYLIHSYLYYVHDVNLISDDLFNRGICQGLLTKWNEVEHRHKHIIKRDHLKASTGYYLNGKYPGIVRGSAIALAKQFGVQID